VGGAEEACILPGTPEPLGPEEEDWRRGGGSQVNLIKLRI